MEDVVMLMHAAGGIEVVFAIALLVFVIVIDIAAIIGIVYFVVSVASDVYYEVSKRIEKRRKRWK